MSVDKQRAEFMVNVSHDLKTPLNAVIGFTSVLLQDHEQDSEKLHQLQLVYRSARLLLSRIDALTNFYRMQAGVLASQLEWIEPGRWTKDLGEVFSESAEQKGLKLEVLDTPTGPGKIKASLKLLGFALDELLSNAIKYTSSGSVTLEFAGLDKSVVWSVSDTGSGIKPEALETLQKSLAGDSWEGLGLGLALARQAAFLMNGRIEVDSSGAGGSRFRLILNQSGDREG